MTALIAGIETGGTKVVCALAALDEPRRIVTRTTLPTRGPVETLADIAAFLRSADAEIAGVGVASFGPLDVDEASPFYGHLTSTPKLGWEGTDVLGAIATALPGVPSRMVTDVNGSALGEARWGAGSGTDDFVYLTVGTGVGGGLINGGRLLAGSGWPEVAHVLVRRHPDDDFAGTCPFHGDCVEGLVAGPAILGRWGTDGSSLDPERAALNLRFSAYYLAQLVATLAYTVGVRVAVIGGGVAKTPGLLPLVEQEVERLMGPPGANGTAAGRIRILPPGLGDDAGVLGALSLAEAAARA